MVSWGVVDACPPPASVGRKWVGQHFSVSALEFILLKNTGAEIPLLEILIEKGWGGN